MKRRARTTFAAIHLGSENLSMQVSEYYGLNRIKVIDYCQRPLRLGEETFKNNIINITLINEICEILTGFRRLMDEYGVTEYKFQATTAVREAENQVFLLDQIYSRTGLVVEVVDLPQEMYTKYVSIRNTLKQEKITSEDGAMLMMNISSGGLGITLVDNNKIRYQQNMHVGVIRIKESFDRNKRESMHFNTALTEFLATTLGPVREELAGERARYLVLSGTETELLLSMMQVEVRGKVHHIRAEAFKELFQQMRKLNLPQIMSRYRLSEVSAELVLPTILIYERLLDVIPVEEIIIADDTFIDGMQLLHIGSKEDKVQKLEWEKELVSLFHMIGKRYRYDKAHAGQVEKISLQIFDKVASRYSMGERERLFLQGAAILHDIGKFINLRSHSTYTYQLIMDTDIIGFSENDKHIMALAAYYHANDLFGQSKRLAPTIGNNELALVAKLAAIIRLADAMDRSYCQKLRSCVISLSEQNLIFSVQSKVDISLEAWSFENKAQFFEDIYGLKPVLQLVERL